MSKDVKRKHESFGMLAISRVQGSSRALFGSSLVQSNTILMTISHADETRHLNQHWYSPRKEIIEVEMSPTQFVDAMTNMNTAGVPVTIRRLDGQLIEACPHEHVLKSFEKEFKEDIQEVLDRTQKLMKMVEAKLKAPGILKKSDRLKMADELYHIEQDIKDNMPFVHRQFNRQMDKTISEAKGEIEAFFTTTIHSLGSKELVKQLDEGKIKHPLLEE